MKSKILIVTAFLFITVGASYFMGCNSPEQKVENAQDDVTKAEQNLQEANTQYELEIENYRREMATRAETNNKSLEELKARTAQQKREAREDYNRRIAELEQKNSDMKRKVDDYRGEGKDKWESFKAEVNHDMDELGKSIDEFRNDNVK